MNPIDTAGSAGKAAGTSSEAGALQGGSIRTAPARVRIDAASSNLPVEITSFSGSSGSPAGTASPMNAVDWVRHEAALKTAKRFVGREDPRSRAVLQSRIELLNGHLESGRDEHAIELFNVIAESLGALPEFRQQGVELSQRVVARIGASTPAVKAAFAWECAAQLEQAVGHIDQALAAFDRELTLLDQIHWTDAAAKIRTRMQELHAINAADVKGHRDLVQVQPEGSEPGDDEVEDLLLNFDSGMQRRNSETDTVIGQLDTVLPPR